MFTAPFNNAHNILMSAGVKKFQFLSRHPDQTQENGYIDASADYSSAPIDFFIKPAVNEILYLYKLDIHVRDAKFDAGYYGDSITLTNGIHVGFGGDSLPAGGLLITQAEPIKANPDWGIYGGKAEISSYGQGIETMNVSVDLSGEGVPLQLVGSRNETMFIRLNDNLSGLIKQFFLVRGLSFIKS